MIVKKKLKSHFNVFKDFLCFNHKGVDKKLLSDRTTVTPNDKTKAILPSNKSQIKGYFKILKCSV